MRSFIAEINAIVRRHVAALEGNALVAYTLIDCFMEDNPHKNQVSLIDALKVDLSHLQTSLNITKLCKDDKYNIMIS